MAWQGIEVVHVVAMDKNNCIGKGNALPWHISADLKHFKAITQGGVVIMGRKTLESMGRALPNRVNWVITRDSSWSFDGVKTANSIESALDQALADVQNSEKPNSIFIIGFSSMIFFKCSGIPPLNTEYLCNEPPGKLGPQ